MPSIGNGFFMDKLVLPCAILIFVNPVVAPVTLWFWGIVAYTPTPDEDEYDEWRGRVRHFETRVSEIVDHRADQMEQRASEQNAELRADMRELRAQNAALQANVALLVAASRNA